MPLLRIKQHIEHEGHYRVEISFKDDDGSEQTPEARFEFALTNQDRADLRWYLEDYLQYPMEPAPQIAARVEERIRTLGVDLFRKVFQSNDETRDLWATLRNRLDDTRVEVVTDVKGATALPWELLCDPKTEAYLALRANSFVRAYHKAVQKAEKPHAAKKVRILLVICRPGGSRDVPFRSVASQLIKGLNEDVHETFELNVLRPPTFEQLSKTLHEAKTQGRPYHIVHFDGHGGYVDLKKVKDGGLLRELMPVMLGGIPRSGPHGYLLFENPKKNDNIDWVDGLTLGMLMIETDTPVLVLNACRSAHAAPLDEPDVAKEVDDPHSQVRAFGSLAQEVMDTGVAGVVAMRYNVYVVTAAKFVAQLYSSLASGQTLGEAVSMGRKQLYANPSREIAFEPRSLQDWSVPLVYEATPIRLFPQMSGIPASIQIDVSKATKLVNDLPHTDIGFFGRDETLLALDRAFDTQSIILLHAYAGSGKTSTAAEFARWYQQTGGLSPRERGEAGWIPGPILYSKFEQYKPLERVLDVIEPAYRSLLKQNNFEWLAMDIQERLKTVLQLFKHSPPLWIWDNIEPVNGFPAGTESTWSQQEQSELKTFMQVITEQTRTKFLLTSRRDEYVWLGDLPCRLDLPPMPMQERVQLARAVAEKHRRRISEVDDWRPLLTFTQGNPLTIIALVGQALRDGLKTQYAIHEFVEKLRYGEGLFSDEATEGRSTPLSVSLSYGFKNAFNESEHRVLALLHFFQGFVHVDTLRMMAGDPNLLGQKPDWALPELADLQPETFNVLLNKAADIGLLTPHGDGYYTIHPALPWFFHKLFKKYYPLDNPEPLVKDSQVSVKDTPSTIALRAFVESMGTLGNCYHRQYNDGNRDIIDVLRAEEANLLYARALARKNGWYWRIINTMQGLDTLYDHTGRRAEWKRLVDEITPDFVGIDDLPIAGREAQWGLVTQYRVRLTRESDPSEAERIQHLRVDDVQRRNATPASLLARPPETLSANEKIYLRTLAVYMEQLGQIQRDKSMVECIQTLQEAIRFCRQIGDKTEEAVIAFNLGHAYIHLCALHNLDEAERWYRHSLELHAKNDKIGIGACLDALGNIVYTRFLEKKIGTLNDALQLYHQAIDMFPPEAVNNLAVSHNQLGLIYKETGDLERALEHYNYAIHFHESAENLYAAGQTRRNVAIALADNERLSDALLYARAAIRNFEPYGQRAADQVKRTQEVIGWIEREIIKGDS